MILTINGVFTDEEGAKNNNDNLKRQLPKSFDGEPVVIDYLHNESHLAGLGDILKSIEQGLFDSETVSDYDLLEMIRSASERVATQKLLLVAHSQGNFYANSFYDVVADMDGGVPAESLAVYSVATPSGRVAGGGKWLTSETDKVIAGLLGRTLSRNIMPPNTKIELQEGDDSLGHNFSGIYLKYRGSQIISDIQSALSGLAASDAKTPDEPCISSPRLTLVHKLTGAFFAVADPIAIAIGDTSVFLASSVYDAGVFAVNTIMQTGSLLAETRESFFGDLGGLTIAIYDKFIATVGPGQTTVTPRSDEAATSTPSQPERTEEPAPVPPPVTASPIAQETIINNPEPSNPTSSPAVDNSQGLVAGTSTPAATTTTTPIVWGVSGTPAPTGGISVSGGSPTPGEGGETPPNSTSTGEFPPEEPPSEPPPTLPVIENFTGEFNLNELAIDFSWTPLATSSTEPIETEIYALSLVGVEPILVATTTENSLNVEIPAWGDDLVYSLQAFGVSTSSADTEEPPADGEFEPISEIATVTVEIPDWLITVQGDASGESISSHYSDNWYRLGTGFYGTIYAIILEGHINGANPTVGASRIYLQEFLDSGYSALNETFTVSEDAPFDIGDPQTLTFRGLNIPVQPNKFYRLLTDHGEQNLSVILSGAFGAVSEEFSGGGTAMWNKFVSGTGRVEETYDFYPFLQIVAEREVPEQSAPTAPEILSLNFNETALALGVAWGPSTDADTKNNLITYEFNYASSTSSEIFPELLEGNWQEVDGFSRSIDLEYPNFYAVGVRAKDDFGNTSPVFVETWSFPEGFIPLVSSIHLNPASQTFTPATGGTLASISVSTAEFMTSSKNSLTNFCSLELYEVQATSSVLIARNDTPNFSGGTHYAYRGSECAGNLTFTYTDEPPEIFTDKTYKWVFSISFSGGRVRFFGYPESTIEGEFSDTSTIADAKFTVLGTGGPIIEN